ncbi:copper chaperone PCu(A)C [Roseibacterium beibuensis]|uniref:copper chaperone PCu(A)C n=1 Tax=[Roseibacterium] beibuensis TaxID=1193142 RepID=UPI00217EAC07|nr:copper chaperone PCu(A)C [Roseibacterium beibuensis]MCS6627181.1 copper chaperone PCu(A)C [Roseibacterium beibuensis]
MFRILLSTCLVACAGLGACSPGTPSGSDTAAVVAVSDALCRPTPVGRQTTGCYLTLTAPADDRLVAVSSPVAGRGQVHESRMESNMMMMRELKDGLPLPAGQAVELKPGGNHIMLLAVTEPLAAGDTVPLTLTFATAAPVEITAPVGQPDLTDSGHASH